MTNPRQRPRSGAGRAGLTALLLLLLAGTSLTAGGCWLWETPLPQQTPSATATPPQVQEAGGSSPAIAGRLLYSAAGHIWMRSGTKAVRLTEDTTGTQPAWSPDGEQIAFVVRGEYYSDIWVMQANGSGAHPITKGQADEPLRSLESVHASSWSAQPQWIPPGGLSISFLSHTPTEFKSNVLSVWIMRSDGSEEERILGLSQNIESAVWSPDGAWLAFTVFPYGRPSQLRTMDPDGNVHELGEESNDLARYDPTWSPDGRWIAYAAREGDQGATDLWLIPSPLTALYDGEWAPLRLTSQGRARSPAWAPDGRQIAFVAAEGETFDIWLLNLDLGGDWPQPTGTPERLTANADVDATSRPSWAP
jgi:TolB protein